LGSSHRDGRVDALPAARAGLLRSGDGHSDHHVAQRGSRAYCRLPPALAEKPGFRDAAALVARAVALSNDRTVADATAALKAAFLAEGLARHY